MGIVSLVIAAAVWIAALLISFHGTHSRENIGGFECGFDSEVSSRSPFSLRFFILLLLFVVFDVEVALLVPCAYSLILAGGWGTVLVFWAFLLVLGVGLFYEWFDGGLDWLI